MNILALTPGEFEAAALAWLAAISLVLAGVIKLAMKYLPQIVELYSQFQSLKEQVNRHGVRIDDVQKNSIPPGMLTLAAPVTSSSQETTALQANTAATQANTAAQEASNPIKK